MSASIYINVPATISSIAGQPSLSSLTGLPAGLAVSDPDPGASLTVLLVAANSAAALTASASGGAAVIANGSTLQISGSAAQVNAALATLEFTEPSGTAADLISIGAFDNIGLTSQSSFAVDIAPQIAPAFVNPTKLVTLSPNQPLALPDLQLSDPTARPLQPWGWGMRKRSSSPSRSRRGVAAARL